MPEKFDKETRSRTMRQVRGKGTSIEVAVTKALLEAGIPFETHPTDLPGKPDIVFRDRRLVVFVHGCFWHWHECAHFRMPVTNQPYWENKLRRNRERFACYQEQLSEMGWSVRVIWECELATGIRSLIEELQPS